MTNHTHQIETSSAQQEEVAISLVNTITKSIREKLGLREQYAVQFAREIVEGLRDQLGGERLYVPMLQADRVERDKAIRSQFNGTNLREVCKQHRVARATVYRVVRRKPADSL
jgi:Mor family transcriptional regulator